MEKPIIYQLLLLPRNSFRIVFIIVITVVLILIIAFVARDRKRREKNMCVTPEESSFIDMDLREDTDELLKKNPDVPYMDMEFYIEQDITYIHTDERIE